MAKTASVHVRMDEQVKNDAIKVFDALGLSVADAITLFFKQVTLKNGIPFELTVTSAPKNNFERVNAIKQDELRKVLNTVPNSVDELWVFGSALTPYCRPDSDIDVCVIGDNITKEDRKQMAHAPRYGMDLINVNHAQFEAEKNELGSIFHEIFTKGLLIYRKGDGLIDE